MDKVGRSGIKMGDLLDDSLFHDKLQANVEENNFMLTAKYNSAPVSFDTIYAEFQKFAAKLTPFIGNVSVEP